jgi:hypothetical protein
MSTALASARRRRAGPEAVAPAPGVRQTTPQFQNGQQAPQNMNQGLTLPQVISLVDKRLNTLETFMQKSQSNDSTSQNVEPSTQLDSIVEEYNSRFDIIAEELSTLKDTIMKLQTYTMEVNKTLMDERIKILSEGSTPLEQALHLVENQL